MDENQNLKCRITEGCIGCAKCPKTCPKHCIIPGDPYKIFSNLCEPGCRICMEMCPVHAIVVE